MKTLRHIHRPIPIPIGLLRCALYLIIALLATTLLVFHPQSPVANRQSPIANRQSPIPSLGINIELDNVGPPQRQAALTRLRATGFGWVRQRLDWGTLEPAPGVYNWSTSDALIADIRAAGLIPVIVLDGSPPWARAPQDLPPTNNLYAPPADFQDFDRFAAAFAGHYRDQLTYYQIWDEPNIAPHWGNRLIEPVAYAQLLKVAATAIRNADPDATILSAALAPTRDRGHNAIDEIYYLQRLYASGAAPYFDILAIQPFGFGASPTDPRISVDRLNFGRALLIRQTMVAAGDGATPVWAVRYGWNRQLASPWATVSEADQTTFAINALTLARTNWPWLTAMAWVIDQPNAPATDPLWGFALSPPLANALRAWGEDHAQVQGTQSLLHERPRLTANIGSTNSLTIDNLQFTIDNSSFSAQRNRFPWLAVGYLATLLVAGGRLVVIGRQLPWRTWATRYRRWPRWAQLLFWSLLATLYYYAVWPPLILLCWLIAAMLLWWQPLAGLWLAAALIPFYAQHKEFTLGVIHFALAPSHALLLCLLPVGMARLWQWRGRARAKIASGDTHYTTVTGGASPAQLSTIAWLALLWLLINLLSAINVWQWSAYGEGMWNFVVMPLLGVGLAMLFLRNRTGRLNQPPMLLVTALFAGGLAVAGGGLLLWLRGEGTAVDGLLRLTGPYFSPNQAALYLERTFLVGLGLLVVLPRYRVVILAGLTIIFTAVLLTASRGALFLGLPAGLLVMGSGWAIRRRNVFAAMPTASRANQARAISLPHLLVAGLLLAIAIVVLLWLALGERLTNSATIQQRWMIWRSSWVLWLDHFWFGVGPGGFFWRYPAYLPFGALDEPNLHHPHNLWLEFATSWGVGGLIWLAVLLVCLICCYRRLLLSIDHQERQPTHWLTLSLLAAITAGLAHAQVDAFFIQPDLALWDWLTLTLLYHLTRIAK